MTNPNLTSDLTIRNAGDVWQPRAASNSMADNTASDPSGYAKSIAQGGSVVRTETGKASIGSTKDANEAQDRAAGVPYQYAVDSKTRCRIGPSELKDDSILNFGERGEVTVASARALGWLTPTNGTPNQPFNEGQEQPKEEVHADLQFDLLADEAIDRDYSNLVDNTRGVEQHEAISQIVESGEITERTLGTLASQLGVEPQQLQGRIAPIMKGFEDQARSVMGEGGFDSSDVVAFAQQNCPDKLRLAMNKQATLRQTSGYAEIRQDYVESLGEHNPSAALNADLGNGITQYQDAKGQVMVRIPGMSEMLWKTAIKSFGVRKS